MPLAYDDPKNPIRLVEHALVTRAGGLQAIITGPAATAHSTLRTRCLNTGPNDDPNPATVLADVRPDSSAPRVEQKITRDLGQPEYKQIDLRAFEISRPDFVVASR